jgi:hypothetical protein
MSNPIEVIKSVATQLSSQSSDDAKDDKPSASAEANPMTEERNRVQTFRNTAVWMLTTLGAAAALAFTGLAVNKIPNMADPNTYWPGFLSIVAVICGLTAISGMVYLVGLVLVTPSINLKELAASTEKEDQWVNDSMVVVPPYETLAAAIAQYKVLQNRFAKDSSDTEAAEELTNKFFPILGRVLMTAQRKAIELRFTEATQGLVLGTLFVSASVGVYLAANAYVPETSAPTKFAQPFLATWTPFSGTKTNDQRNTLKKSLQDVLNCSLERINVLVLSVSADEKTFSVIVQDPSCTLQPKSVTLPNDGDIIRHP